MQHQHALIVDDSKTAQLRLRRMLGPYDLIIDVVSSAEEALSYLSYRSPAVIFLDQSMKGMDGIDALKTIKANPTTATIPVIMYTSEKGTVFTGQARALGALDILYKSTLKPSSLEKVLSTLKLKPKQNIDKSISPENAPPSTTSNVTPLPLSQTTNSANNNNVDLNEIHTQIARLFEIHIADVGRKITESTLLMSKRFAAFQNKMNNAKSEIVVNDIPLSIINDEVSAERKRIALVSNALLVAVLGGLLIIGVLLWGLRSDLKMDAENYHAATAISEMNATQIQQLTQDVYREKNIDAAKTFVRSNNDPLLLNAISWAAATDFTFQFNQEPLNEVLLFKFQQLLYMLSEVNFEGTIELMVNFGNTCLALQENGEYVLAPDSTPITNCIFRTTLNEKFDISDYINIAFTDFEETSTPLQDGLIKLTVSSNGLSTPRTTMPSQSKKILAKEWNDLALENNYVSFFFHTETEDLSKR